MLYTTAFVFAAPISTTQTITSAILGAGATQRLSAVRWGVAGNILWPGCFTIPMAAWPALDWLPARRADALVDVALR